MAPVTIKKTATTTLDVLLKEGRELGMEQKTERAVRNMILKGSTTEFICDVLEVTSDYIARIRREMEAGK